ISQMVTGRSLRFENVAISWRSWTSTPPGLSTEPALRATHQSRSQRTAPQVRTQRSPNRPIATPRSVKMPVTTWSLTFFCACSPRLHLRPSCSAPPPQVIQAICHSREPQRSKPRLEAGQRRGARTPCKVSGASPLEGVAEALRSYPRGSQRVLEVYSSPILKLVRCFLSPSP